MKKLAEILRANSYPGRGIILGQTPDGKESAALYFIMGRSSNSRNRIFAKEPDGIRTEAFDPSKLQDPSLIIYHPVRSIEGALIVTNGDQTDTIKEFMQKDLSPEAALRTRCFEPDGPNWTPRISGILFPDGSFRLSILKAADADGEGCLRYFFDCPAQPGRGRFIHTYSGDGNPLPSFSGEPEEVEIPQDAEGFSNEVWEALDPDNKISLYARYTKLSDGSFREFIFNKNKR